MGAGCSLGSQIANNKDGKIDWGDVAIQGAAGAAFAVLPGAVVGKSVTGLARYAGIGAVNAAIGGAATLATDLKNGEKKEQIVKDVAASTASNFVCGMLNEKVNTEIGHSLDEMKAEKQRPFTEKINELEDDIASRQDKVRGLNRARKAKGVTGRGKNAKGKAMLTHNKNIKKLKEARTENENISKQVCREIDIKYGPLIRGLQKTMDWLYGIELEGGLEGFIQKQKCNLEIPVAPGEEHWLLDTSLDEVYWTCSHSRAMPSFPSQLEWKIGLAWANTRGSLNSPS